MAEIKPILALDPSLGEEGSCPENPIIRNFSIIAHIDHGKSTLSDRLLQSTNAITEREAREQMLDSMDLERERGITIKASAVSVRHIHQGKHYLLNFIDTPGHVDFSYEVSRALTACEGAVLVVDSTQGVEAQTVANTYLAVDNNLEIITVINKIDLPAAEPEERAMEVEQILGFPAEDSIFASAKTGQGIPELLEAICERLPSPREQKTQRTRALIFDSHYDDYRGVVVYIRMFDGKLTVGDKIRMMGTGRTFVVTELGKYTPKPQKVTTLGPGETGYLIANIKALADVRVGDTITQELDPAEEALPGYEEPRQMVFCDFYPATSEDGKGQDFENLREAMEKLALNDASFTYQAVHSEALGFGFRCGFLGLLHLEIITERLDREFGIPLVATAPSVSYHVVMQDPNQKGQAQLDEHGERVMHVVSNPQDLPEPNHVLAIEEPTVKAMILVPTEYVGPVMQLCEGRRGHMLAMDYLTEDRVELRYHLPLAEIITDFFDQLKSLSRGYASLDYERGDYQPGDLVKVDVLLNGEAVDAFSSIVHKDNAYGFGKDMVERLRELIPRQMFDVPIQAAIGAKIIARETIKARRKDVLAKCYGGDVSRKRKLLERQKEGKKKMKAVGSVEVPPEAFVAALRSGSPK
ncbi:MAG: translation elongation factor 4, partial [Phycisphaerales bacterium JB050]